MNQIRKAGIRKGFSLFCSLGAILATIALGLLCGAAVTISVWGIESTIKTVYEIARALFDMARSA
jgi:hypothetical protein